MKSVYALFAVELLVLFFLPNRLNAQETILSGVVREQSGPIANSTIENLSKKTGVVADAQGKFSIKAAPGDTLIFKSLGYQNKTIIGFKKTPLTIHLEPEIYELNSVVIAPKDPVLIKKGYLKGRINYFFLPNPGSIFGYFITTEEIEGKIPLLFQVSFFIGEGIAKTPIRVRCLALGEDGTSPGKDLYKDEIIVRPKRNNSWQKVDLSTQKLRIPKEGMFVVFEYFEEKPEYYYEYTYFSAKKEKLTKQAYGTAIGGYSSSEPSKTWQKHLGKKWTNWKMTNFRLAVRYTLLYGK
jgi:hypothetical protein